MQQVHPAPRPSSQSHHADSLSPVPSQSSQARHRSVYQTPTSPHDSLSSPVNMVGLSHPMPRQRVYFGPYLLLQTLGEGEFGKVKLGVHSSPDRWGEEVAIKLIKRGNVDTQARMIKVAREIDVLKLVKHPNIVRLYDVIETEKYIGIVLEYASGGELFDHILAHRYLKEKDASKLFAQLISGVTYLHAKKIVHRDLKLENLLLDRNRNIIITDFGFANRFEDRSNDLMATSCGSPCYAAPELVVQDGRYVGSQVDVWSCGVILYAMLAGYLPFDDDPSNPDGDNINLLYKYIINTPLSFPDWITDEPKDLLSKMLVPDPLKRCSLKDVTNHSWLAKYQHLFHRSLEELERISDENEQTKRLALQRQRQLMATNSSNRSRPSLGPDSARTQSSGNAAAVSKSRGHQSAVVVPTSGLLSPHESIHPSQVSAYQQQQRQVPGGGVTHLHSNSHQPPVTPSAVPSRRQQHAHSAVVVPVSSLNKENEVIATLPDPSTDQMMLDEDVKTSGSSASSGRKRKVAGNTPTSASNHSGPPPSHQRYTVQVEYTADSKGKGRSIDTSSTIRDVMEVDATVQGVVAVAEDDPSTPTPRMSNTAIGSSIPSSSSPGDLSLQATPQPGRMHPSSNHDQSHEESLPSMKTPKPKESVLTESAEGPSPTVPFPSPRVDKPIANKVAPGHSTSGNKNSSQVSFSATSQTSVLPNGSPTVASTKAQARHRKGLSTDRFFSRLLGVNAPPPSNPPPLPNSKKASVYTTNAPTSSKAARRKALSLVVEPLSNKISSGVNNRSSKKTGKLHSSDAVANDSLSADQAKRRARGTSVVTTSASSPNGLASPSSTAPSSTAQPKRRITLAGSHGRSDPRAVNLKPKPTDAPKPENVLPTKPSPQQSESFSSRVPAPSEEEHQVRQREGRTGSPNWSHHTPAASVANSTGQASNSSKAKRVMDWFRFKSLNGSTVSAHQTQPHANDHLIPPVPIATDFDTRNAVNQVAAATTHPEHQSPSKGHLIPSASKPAPHISSPALPHQSSSRISSKAAHRFTLAHPRPSTSTAAEFRSPLPLATSGTESSNAFNESKLKLHHGAIDQNAISSKLPMVIMQQLKQILWEMGIDVVEESSVKLKATRRSKKKVVASLGMGVFEALQQQQHRLQHHEQPTGALKSLFNKRPSTATSTNQQIGIMIDQFGNVSTGGAGSASAGGGSLTGGSAASANGSEYPNGTQPLPSYADDPSVDSGDDVRFTVEITRLRGLVGLYAVDIKRLKGSLWSFKYLYLQILERADLGQKA